MADNVGERIDRTNTLLEKLLSYYPIKPEITLPPDIELKFPAILNTIPCSPEYLLHLLSVVWKKKNLEIDFPTWSIAFLCPAGAVTELPYYLPNGLYCLQETCYFYSTFHSSDIKVSLIVDDESCTAPFGIGLTADCPCGFGQHYVKRRYLKISVDNGSASDALVTFHMTCNMIGAHVYENVYEPLLLKIYEKCEEVAHG